MEYHEHLLEVSGVLESEEDTIEIGSIQDDEPFEAGGSEGEDR